MFVGKLLFYNVLLAGVTTVYLIVFESINLPKFKVYETVLLFLMFVKLKDTENGSESLDGVLQSLEVEK